MTRGGGPSVAEVATSFPARLLGAIEELQEFSKFSERRRKRKRESQEISLKKEIFSCSARSGFYRPISA